MENDKIRILNIVPNMRAAGIESFIMNVYRNIDREKVQFDFIVHNTERNFFDDEIEKLGGKIYRFTYKDDKNIIKYIKDLNSFFKEHKEYKIVHGHMQSMMPLYLLIAQINKVPIRIAHSHNGSYEKTLKGFILHIFSRFSKLFSTDNWACSYVAGKYLFGNQKFEIVYNGIDTSKFEFNKDIRKIKRRELGIDESTFLIGHIGRFELQKNHKFLIRMFEKCQKENSKIKLILIGEGKLEQEIKKMIENLKIDSNVDLLGLRKDVNELYSAMDLFVLPSLYEGLPVVGIEAQTSGVSCIFSKNITNELKMSNNSYFMDIENDDDVENWKMKVLEIKNKKVERSKITNSKFDIKQIAKEVCIKYYERYNE